MTDYRTQGIVDPPIVEFKGRLSGKINKDSVIDLSQAVPSYPMPPRMKSSITVGLGDQVSYYTEDQGIVELREEICRLHNVGGVNIDASNVMITAGASQAAFSLFTALFKEGDRVALPVPYYFNYDMGLRMLGVEPVYYYLDEGDSFRLVVDKLDKDIFRTCKAFIVVNPNNPTGAEYDDKELMLLYRECEKNNVMLIADEAYGFFSKQGYPGSSMLSRAKDLNRLCIVNSFSKTFSITGLRVGYLICSDEVMKEVMKVQDTLIICAPSISQQAALTGLRECRDWLDEKVSYVHANVRDFTRLFNSRLEKFKLSSCSNFFAYVRHPYHDRTSVQVCEMMAREAGVLTLPGSIFGPGQENFFRLAFGNLSSKSQLEQVVERLSVLEQSIRP